MPMLEVLAEKRSCASQLSRLVPGISQKRLTQTLRRRERDGMAWRKVHAVVRLGLGAAFCGVWLRAEENLARVEGARQVFDEREV
jgi:hypothetical protein